MLKHSQINKAQRNKEYTEAEMAALRRCLDLKKGVTNRPLSEILELLREAGGIKRTAEHVRCKINKLGFSVSSQ